MRIKRRGADVDGVRRRRSEQRVGGDDCALCVCGIEADRERHGGFDGDRVAERRRIHLACEVDGEVGRGIDVAVEVGGSRPGDAGRSLGGERPVMAKRVGVAGHVSISGLQHHLVSCLRQQCGMLELELSRAKPCDRAHGGRDEEHPARDRLLVDVVIERDPNRHGSGDIDRPAFRRVIDDLGWAAAARRERGNEHEQRRCQNRRPHVIRLPAFIRRPGSLEM